MQKINTNMSSRKASVRDLPLPLPFNKEEKQPCFTEQAEDPGYARAASTGMTSLFDIKAFTLIELLVVVLIIGILAAVALPQYQKVVERSKATQAITLLRSVYDAAQAYQLANGEWPTSFDELAVEIPWTGTRNAINLGHHQRGKSNADWSIQMRNSGTLSNARGVTVGRISGPYKGAQFYMYAVPAHPQYTTGELLCVEIKNTTDAVSPFSKTTGTYCEKIMKATHINTSSNGSWDFFRMP